MKRILCYGDSNVWGFNPETFSLGTPYFLRYGEEIRWPMELQRILGKEYQVIEEGLCGRTTVRDDPYKGADLNGLNDLKPCLESHKAVDLVVLLLGTNDLKASFALTAADIARDVETLVHTIQTSGTGPQGTAPGVLLLAPACFTQRLENSCLRDLFDVPKAIETSRELVGRLEEVARRNRCDFLKCDDFAQLSPLDEVHFTAAGHQKLARGIAEKIAR